MIPATAIGPGVGGMKEWATPRPASKGNPNVIAGRPARRAAANTSGARMISATSKNTGIEARNPISDIAQRPAPTLRLWSNLFASAVTPPDASSMAPNSAPRPITTAMKPSVPPMPATTVSSAFSGGMPAATALRTATRMRATKAFIRAQRMRTSSAKTPAPVAISG